MLRLHRVVRSRRGARLGAAALVALVALLPAGCSGGGEDDGGDDGPGSGRAGGEARESTVRAGLAALFAGDHADGRDVESGNCFAAELTGAVSLEALRDAGVLDDGSAVVADLPPLPEEVARAWARAQLACTDFVEESARAQAAASRGAADATAYAACLRAELPADDVEAALVETLTGTWDGPALARLGAAQAACATG